MWSPQILPRLVGRTPVPKSVPGGDPARSVLRRRGGTLAAVLVTAVLATACPAPPLATESSQRIEFWERMNMPYQDRLAADPHSFTGWWREQVRDGYGFTSKQVAGFWNANRTLGAKPDPFRLDVSTDWCGPFGVATVGPAWDFHAACLRHDFGYRNLKMLDRRWNCSDEAKDHRRQCRHGSGRLGRNWNEGSRKRVDYLFVADMYRHCEGRPRSSRRSCRGAADTLFAIVRLAG